jgi:hypothetical protein
MVVSNAQDAANEFPEGAERDRYVAAANTLRIPYWDWAKLPPSGQHSTPDFLSSPSITVNTPNGSQTIYNPLYTYKFHPIDQGLTYSMVGNETSPNHIPNAYYVVSVKYSPFTWPICISTTLEYWRFAKFWAVPNSSHSISFGHKRTDTRRPPM